jgi:hypothetical protein
MNFKSKIVGFVATAVVALGIGGSALATPAGPTQNVQVQIGAGTQFSVAFIHATNFGNAAFSLGVQNSATIPSASYDFTVTDLRGTGDGWHVNVSSTDFTNGPVTATGAVLSTTNNTQWASFLPGGAQSANGWVAGAGSITTGVTRVDPGFGANLIGTERTVLQSSNGVSLIGAQPNGTGTFSSEHALFLAFPAAVAAGTYTSTVTLTLTSGLP